MEDASKQLLAKLFSLMFLTVTVCLVVLSLVELWLAFSKMDEKDLIGGMVRAINTTIMALATFELGIGISKEYSIADDGADLFPVVRRSVTRFVSVVCVALVLESLIMVIKYSQLEMTASLYYPVAVVASASALLVALGLFIHLTRPEMRAEVSEPAPRPSPEAMAEAALCAAPLPEPLPVAVRA